MWRRWNVLVITAVSVIGIQTAQPAEPSNNPAETAEVTVTGEATGSLTSFSPEESAKQKTFRQSATRQSSAARMHLNTAR
jgi:hypothetical protein